MDGRGILVKQQNRYEYDKSLFGVRIMTREEEIRKASREYAMTKSNEKNTYFVDYKDIEEAFIDGANFACAYSEARNNTERRIGNGN